MSVWELSPAYDTYHLEQREHVARNLDMWKAPGSNEWPAHAQVGRVGQPKMTPAWFNQIVALGQSGVHRSIAGNKIVGPGLPTFPSHALDVYFISARRGNDGQRDAGPSLFAYIIDNAVTTVELGCHHASFSVIKTMQQYKRFRCDLCHTEWGVDTSG